MWWIEEKNDKVETFQHLPKGVVWTLRDGVFRHPLLSIQHPLEDSGFQSNKTLSVENGRDEAMKGRMVERYEVSPSIGRARAKVVLSRSYFGETAAEIGRVRGGNLKMSGCQAVGHLQWGEGRKLKLKLKYFLFSPLFGEDSHFD